LAFAGLGNPLADARVSESPPCLQPLAEPRP
jgi:hypothetical protein